MTTWTGPAGAIPAPTLDLDDHGPAEYLAISGCGCASSPTRQLVSVCPRHSPRHVSGYRRVSLSELMRAVLISPAELTDRLHGPSGPYYQRG